MNKQKVKQLVGRQFENVVRVSKHGNLDRCWHVFVVYNEKVKQFVLQETIKGWVADKTGTMGDIDDVLESIDAQFYWDERLEGRL